MLYQIPEFIGEWLCMGLLIKLMIESPLLILTLGQAMYCT